MKWWIGTVLKTNISDIIELNSNMAKYDASVK